MSRPEGGLILIMLLFRILKNVIACLIIRLRSRVCQLSVSTRLVGLVVLLCPGYFLGARPASLAHKI